MKAIESFCMLSNLFFLVNYYEILVVSFFKYYFKILRKIVQYGNNLLTFFMCVKIYLNNPTSNHFNGGLTKITMGDNNFF